MQKKLYLSSTNKKILGICGGIGEYLELDPTIIRVVFVLFALAYGAGILAYFLLYLIIPKAPEA